MELLSIYWKHRSFQKISPLHNGFSSSAFLCKKKKKGSSNQWLSRQNSDPLVKLAQESGYRARSSFKLLELNKKYSILESLKVTSNTPLAGSFVIECGCAPGGWSQIISEQIYQNHLKSKNSVQNINIESHANKISRDSLLPDMDMLDKVEPRIAQRIIAIDILPIIPLNGVKFICGDFLKEETKKKINQYVEGHKVGLILSDMAPSLSGNKTVDDSKSMRLCLEVLSLAEVYLSKGGFLVMKYFMGESHIELRNMLQSRFKTVQSDKPSSSRKESAEQYFVCSGYTGK